MKEEEIEQRQFEIINEIKEDQDYCEFFEAYSESSVEIFIERYAYHKACLEYRGNHYQRIEEKKIDSLMKAEKCQIQMKKLFDLECQWRADQITLPAWKLPGISGS